MNSKLIFLTDENEWFWTKFSPNRKSIDKGKLAQYFENAGYETTISRYEGLDKDRNYKGVYVVYTASEETGGAYRQFMIDVLIWLEMSGAILLPEFPFMRGAYDKVMMELIRKNKFGADDPLNASVSCGMFTPSIKDFPAVIKGAEGAGSSKVFKVDNDKQLKEKVKKLSKIDISIKTRIFMYLASIRRRIQKLPEHKIDAGRYIVQKYIDGLNGDYKVLIFGEHYFVLHRMPKEGDFRSSGSGIFVNYSLEEIKDVLDYAKKCYDTLNVPYASLDIGKKNENCYLIEFQTVSFGLKAMCYAESYFVKEKSEWTTVNSKVDVEKEFFNAIDGYIKKNE